MTRCPPVVFLAIDFESARNDKLEVMQDVDMWHAGFANRFKRTQTEALHIVRDDKIGFFRRDHAAHKTLRIRMIEINEMPQRPLQKWLDKIVEDEVEIARSKPNHSSTRLKHGF